MWSREILIVVIGGSAGRTAPAGLQCCGNRRVIHNLIPKGSATTNALPWLGELLNEYSGSTQRISLDEQSGSTFLQVAESSAASLKQPELNWLKRGHRMGGSLLESLRSVAAGFDTNSVWKPEMHEHVKKWARDVIPQFISLASSKKGGKGGVGAGGLPAPGGGPGGAFGHQALAKGGRRMMPPPPVAQQMMPPVPAAVSVPVAPTRSVPQGMPAPPPPIERMGGAIVVLGMSSEGDAEPVTRKHAEAFEWKVGETRFLWRLAP